MDDASFALTGPLRVLHQAGIRYLFSQQKEAPQQVSPSVAASAPDAVEIVPAALGESVTLPDVWQGFFAKVPATASVIFTYPDLYFDLTGQSSPQRSNLWRSIVPALGLPKGTIGFWPHTQPTDDVLQPKLEYFLAGLQRIQPTHLVLFGVASDLQLMQKLTATITWQPHPVCFEAPSPENLMALQAEPFDAFLTRLRIFTHS